MSGFVSAPLVIRRSERTQKRFCCPCASLNYDVDVAVVGGGVGGLSAARALHLAGRQAVVFERLTTEATTGQALGLWTNGWRALESLGVDVSSLRLSRRNERLQIVAAADGRNLASMQLPAYAEFRYVQRELLLEALGDGLKDVRLGTAVEAVRPIPSGGAELTLDDGTVLRARVVVGADGVRSVVREALRFDGTTRVAAYKAWRGSAIAPAGGMPGLQPGTLLQVWGAGERLGATYVSEDVLHWFYTSTRDGGDDDDGLQFVQQRVKTWGFETALAVAELPQKDFIVTRCGDRFNWLPPKGEGCVTLLGDAAHLSTPNLGQGAALAIEDAVVLGKLLGKTSKEAEEAALREYERVRWGRTLVMALRSAAVGIVVHQDADATVWLRDNVMAQVTARPEVLLRGLPVFEEVREQALEGNQDSDVTKTSDEESSTEYVD